MSFTYDDTGIRTSKTVNGVTHTYQLSGSQIISEQWEDKLLVYLYDATGSPIGMMYRTTLNELDDWSMFWYEKNLQGDIVAVYNSAGMKLVTYTYDAWGNQTVSYCNGGGTTPAQYNPFRYRGYYYDTDLDMYYLRLRYYDAKICRFINADVYISTGYGVLGCNMFAYCNNNPVCYSDHEGKSFSYTCDFDDDYDIEDDVWRYAGGGGGGGGNSGGVSYGSGSSTSSTIGYSSSNYIESNPLSDIVYTEKVWGQMSKGDYHGFPMIVDNYGAYGTTTQFIGGDGSLYTKVCIGGSYRGALGYFEYIYDSNRICNHRLFREQ